MEKTRLYFIDNLRILLITLVAMLHLAITYGAVGSWYYRNAPEGYMPIPLTWHNTTVQAFAMGLFCEQPQRARRARCRAQRAGADL